MTTKATERQQLLKEFHQLFHIKFHEKFDFIEFKNYIKKGVNVDALISETHEKHEKWSPLFWACNRSKYDIVKYLIDNGGANVDLKDGAEHTALHVAAAVGAYRIVDFLLKNGCKKYINVCDVDLETTLHLCADYGSEETFDMLLKHGGNPSLKNNENETPTDLLLDSSKTISEKKFRERKYLNI